MSQQHRGPRAPGDRRPPGQCAAWLRRNTAVRASQLTASSPPGRAGSVVNAPHNGSVPRPAAPYSASPSAVSRLKLAHMRTQSS